MPNADPLPIHFFTIVLNGEPFIRYHIERFRKLPCQWHWHIVEGLAELKHDTAWSLELGGTLPPDVVRQGRSVDGTAEYLDQIAAENPGNVTLYRAPNGRNWDGKLEMVSAPLVNLPDRCLLWEIDSDELWTVPQLTSMRQWFLRSANHTAAIFVCLFFVGHDRIIRRTPGQLELVWTRVWRYQRGMKWTAHEPPTLAVQHPVTRQWIDVAAIKPFTESETAQLGLIFQHFAYATEAQLQFKQSYYGYAGITDQWHRLQQAQLPCKLKDYFNWSWVNDCWIVDTAAACGVTPLGRVVDGRWFFGEVGRADK